MEPWAEVQVGREAWGYNAATASGHYCSNGSNNNVQHETFCQRHFEILKKRKDRLLLTGTWDPETWDGNTWVDEPENLKSLGPWVL